MPLIVEDGSIVSGANCYVVVADVQTYAKLRGITLTQTPAQLSGFIVRSTDFLESFRDQYKGVKTNAAQFLQWPRTIDLGSYVWQNWNEQLPTTILIDGFAVASNVIPPILKSAQCQCVIEQCNGVNLMPTNYPNQIVQRQKIGPIDTTYFPGAWIWPLMPAVDALMDQLLDFGNGAWLRTTRV